MFAGGLGVGVRVKFVRWRFLVLVALALPEGSGGTKGTWGKVPLLCSNTLDRSRGRRIYILE